MHKNKTLATLLALLAGGIGAHRFYLFGKKDTWAWLHTSSLVLCGAAWLLLPGLNYFFHLLPLLLSSCAGFLETLVIGLTPDEKWDATHKNASASDSSWPLAILLVATMLVGTTVLIATISRLFDLLYTGGAYG